MVILRACFLLVYTTGRRFGDRGAGFSAFFFRILLWRREITASTFRALLKTWSTIGRQLSA